MQETIQNFLNYAGIQTMQSLTLVLPKVMGAFFALVFGILLARIARGVILKLLHSINFSKFINKTPLQFAFGSENLGVRVGDAIANIAYWLTMLVIVHTAVSILDLNSLTRLLDIVLGYIPNVISATFILLFGIAVGGWVESLVKNATKTIDQKSARFVGKISGYVVVVLTAMTALSELGIADEFISILFMGFVTTISLGAGLAIGLGGKTVVEKMLGSWYENRVETNEVPVVKKPSKSKKS